MAQLPDVNLVVAAFRQDHDHHEIARTWLGQTVAADDRFGMPVTVWGSLLRVVTNPRIFMEPSPVATVFEFIDEVRGQPSYMPVEPAERHLSILGKICAESQVRGDLVPDAILAAIALENACEIVTLDRDFARFPSLRYKLLAS